MCKCLVNDFKTQMYIKEYEGSIFEENRRNVLTEARRIRVDFRESSRCKSHVISEQYLKTNSLSILFLCYEYG